MAKLHIYLEDRLLLKLIQAVQSLVVTPDVSPTTEIQNLFDSHRVEAFEKEIAQKIFFEDIRINQGDMVVSLIVTGKIDNDLIPIKKNLGLSVYHVSCVSFLIFCMEWKRLVLKIMV